VARAELLLTPPERAREQRLGLAQLALLHEQHSQVIHRDKRVRVARAELLLAPLEREPVQRLGLVVPALRLKQPPKRICQAPIVRLRGERGAARPREPTAELAQHLLVELAHPHARLHRAQNVGLVLGLGRLRLVQRDP